ncbi:Response regulator receiver domain-containing protein [Rhizobium sp. RU35A]|nr:Response regulator receiver domain-containing protein [Rhizobium sp. RU35A]
MPFHAPRPRILVLEDDMLLAMDMEDHLVSRGYEVCGPYGRVGQALEAIPQLSLAGAIADLNLAGELSFPVIDCLRQHGVPVIVCSGYAELPQVKARLDGLPLIAKPWSPERLDDLIAQTFHHEPMRVRRR